MHTYRICLYNPSFQFFFQEMKEHALMVERTTAANQILTLYFKIERYHAGLQFYEKEVLNVKLSHNFFLFFDILLFLVLLYVI